MHGTWGRQVVQATSQFHEMAEGLADRRWETRAGGLEWSCHETARHIAADLTKYAAQLVGGVALGFNRFIGRRGHGHR